MNTNPFLVNALLNDTHVVQALIYNGYLCSDIISDALTNYPQLLRIEISPCSQQTAEQVTKNKPIVQNITYLL